MLSLLGDMINDDYTREYDRQERQRTLFANLDQVGRAAQRLGLQLFVISTAKRITLRILYPAGELFKEFRKIETALAWAQKYN